MKRIHPPIWALSIAAIAIPLIAVAQDFEIVSPPNAWNTTPLGIRNGKVYGSYQDLTDARIRGFTYSRSEGYVIFEVTDADPAAGTVAAGVDDAGRIAGYFTQSPQKTLGYIRQPNGQMRFFDANSRSSAVTSVTGMNGLGFVTGDYRLAGDPNYWPHGYLRSPVGVIFHIDLPGTAMTYPSDINESGIITGWYAQTLQSPARGFIRQPPVFNFTFDPPANCSIGDGYFQRLNNLGDLIGTCTRDIYFGSGYVRWRTGVMERIDFPGASAIDGGRHLRRRRDCRNLLRHRRCNRPWIRARSEWHVHFIRRPRSGPRDDPRRANGRAGQYHRNILQRRFPGANLHPVSRTALSRSQVARRACCS